MQQADGRRPEHARPNLDCHHVAVFDDNLQLRELTGEEIAGDADFQRLMKKLDEWELFRKRLPQGGRHA